MPDPRIRRSRSHGARHGGAPKGALPGDAAGIDGEPTPPLDVAGPPGEPDGAQHLEAAAAASAEQEAAALAADDVAGEDAALAAGATAAGDEAPVADETPVADEAEPVGWFRDAPIATDDEPAGTPAEVPPDELPAEAPAGEPVGDVDEIVRDRDLPVVVPVTVTPPERRARRWRSVLIGLVTIVAVAAVGFVAGLMLPTILPGPGVGSTPLPSVAPSESPVATLAPTFTPAPTPAATPVVTPTPTPASTPSATQVVYVVKAGDQLARIAAKYGVTVAAIQAANNIKDPNLITVGQKLVIPLPPATAEP